MLALLALAFKPVVEGDGIGYFSFLHTLVVDRDLDFANEYAAARAAGVTLWPALVETMTATGRLADFFPSGPALLSLPAYLVGLAAQPGGEPQYSPWLVGAFTVASAAYGLLALALSYRLAAPVAGPRAAAAGAAAIGLGSALPYYLAYEPSYSHTFSAFAVSLFVLAWWSGRQRRGTAGWLLLGLLGGLMALVRWQDGPLLAIALLDLRRARWRVLLLVPGVLLAFLPQLLVDHVLFGTWLPQRPPGQELTPWPGHYRDVLLSSWHGLFIWHPVLLAATAGYLGVRRHALQAAFVYALAVETLINGSVPDWWGGFAFGARRFLDLVPFFVLGAAALAARVGVRRAWWGIWALAAWNLVLIANFTYVIRTDHDPGYRGLVAGQLPALGHLPNLFAQGAVVRDLVLWPVLGQPFRPREGLGLLLALAVAVAIAALAARGGARRRASAP